MEISLKLSKDFERSLEYLKTKYGEDFEYLNGLHPSQLDYSEFIDNFVQKDTLADASIDPNANANHKDIRSFMTEKGKSADKLFALNKIFMTIKKQWGLMTAREWLEQEFNKGLPLRVCSSWTTTITKHLSTSLHISTMLLSLFPSSATGNLALLGSPTFSYGHGTSGRRMLKATIT